MQISFTACDECGAELPTGREMRGVTKQQGQIVAELCEQCCETLIVKDAIEHMAERVSGTRPRPTPVRRTVQ